MDAKLRQGGGTGGALMPLADKTTLARGLFEAYQKQDRARAELLLADDFTFTSPYDDAISRADFFTRCWPPGDHFAELRIERITADLAGAYITYLVTTEAGTQFRNTEYLAVADGQIHGADVYLGASYVGGNFTAKKPE